MGHTLLCVLGFFSLSLFLYCGHAQDAVLSIEPNWSTLFTGESVTFICDVRVGKDTNWYYKIKRNNHDFLQYSTDNRRTVQLPYAGHSGEYQCVGDPPHSAYSRKESNKVSLTVSDKDVILQSPASTVFEGESVTLRCRHRDRTKEKNAVFYKDGSPIETDTDIHQSAVSPENTVQVISNGSSYTCKFEDDKSEPIKLKMESQPKARLSRHFPSGGSVTLTCSVSPSSSSGWKYFWYRGKKTSDPLTEKDVVFLSNETIRVSQGGLYWCRGGRGDPVYYTEYSDPVVTNRAVVTLRPNWPEIYYLETITLTCEIEDGGDAEWEYEWRTSSSYRPEKQKENMIRKALSSYDGGDYRCRGTLKHEQSSTEWSDAFKLTVSDYKPRPVLTVSPLWLSPGASVTLNCSVEHPSAGWRFFWYKTVPKLSDYSYSYELLPGSINGTEQDSYIVDGQTHTAGYVCRAGRGDPVYYTHYSEPKFVWSEDSHSAASLTVSPDRMQHFSYEPVSLSCEGNSTEWRVSRFSEDGSVRHCSPSSSPWGTMNGSRCIMDRSWLSGVYWCESGTGQFSNAVTITIQYHDIILVSPVHPVTEGDSVTLGCKLRTKKDPYDVNFYKNDQLIQNVTGGVLTISAVSKSDEGFYKCEGKRSPGGRQALTSPQSWMSVKLASRPEQSPPFPVLLIVGPVCGVLLILLLLLCLYHYRKSKDSCFIRSQSTNKGPAPDHMINQDETQCREYASPLHDDAVFYESIKGFEEPEHGESKDVTYSVVELKNITKKGKKKEEPEESAVYSDVKIRSAADDNVMYAQVNSQSKAKKDKGKSRPAAADETVYSEVKPGKALDQ